MMKFKFVYSVPVAFLVVTGIAYGYPNVNLGFTNILDGGPLRPQAGLYLQTYNQVYHASKFVDNKGHDVAGVQSPVFNTDVFISQLLYQSDYKILFKGNFGFQAFIPFALYSAVQPNPLGIASSGPGMGDLTAGPFLQWDPIFYNGREFLVHRLEFDVFFPIGKNKAPEKSINVGNGVYVINPYWAGTLYLNPKLTASWRAHYAWPSKNKKSGLQFGDAFHTNFDCAVEAYPKLWIGLCGYYLQQIHDNKKCTIKVPDSKARVLGIGPGFLYFLPKELEAFGYLYFERKARNVAQGISFIVRFMKYF